MTNEELQTVVAAVIQSLKTNSKTIAQLTEVHSIDSSDYFEISGGRKVSYGVLLDLLSNAIVIDTEGITADIAKVVIQTVAFDVSGSTATLRIKQAGYDAKTVSVPIATDSQSGFMTAADKDKLDSTYSKQEIDAEVDAIRDEMMPRINNLATVVNGKQDKLVAGDDATRLNGAKLSTKQIFTGSIDTTAGAVPMLLPVGGCIYNSADKKLYIGDSNSQPVEVAKPDDFLFFSNGKLYHYQFGNFGEVETGTTLVAGDGATRINASALSTKQIYRGTVININGVPQVLPVGAYCFNTVTKKLYVGDSNSQPVEIDMPDDFLFVDTASGTTYRCDGKTLNNIDNIKTINGQSLLGKGNVQLTGADFLLEQGAELTINEALKNKLDKASIVQTTGQATDKVMSQKSVTDDINSAISFARRQGVPQAKCFQFSKNYTFYSGSQLKDKTLIVGLYGSGEILKGSIYYNNSVHELQIGNGERKRLTGRTNTSNHAETLVVYFDDDGIAHAYMDGKLCYDFPSNTQPDTVTINVLESIKFKQILLLDGDLHQAANDLLWAKGWQDWLINNRNMNTTREVKKIDNSTDRWMAIGTIKHKLYVVDYNITNNTEKEVKVSVNTGTIGYGEDIVIPAGQSVSVRRLINTSGQGALGYNDKNLPFSLTAKSVAVIKGIDYRYVYSGGYYDLAGLVPTDEPTIIPNPEEYLKIKSNNTYPDAVGQIGYDTTGRLYMGAIDLTWKQINNT